MAGFGEVIQEFGVKISLAFDEKAAKNAQSKIQSLGKELATFGAEVAALGAGVFAIANSFTSNARSLEDQSAQLGISTKALQEWEYAAKVAANVSREDLVDSMKTLGKFMDEARAGVPEATQALYDIAKAGGQDPSQFIKKLQDPTYKVTDAMKELGAGLGNLSEKAPQAAARLSEMVFGSSKLMPMFKEGAAGMDKLTQEADRNWVINDKMLKQGKQMDQQFTKIWLTFKKMGYEIGFNVLKHIEPLVNQFKKWLDANKGLINSGINSFLDETVNFIKEMIPVFVAVGSAVKTFVDYLGGVGPTAKILLDVFLALKAFSIVGSFAQSALAVGQLVTAISSMTGLTGILSRVGAALAPVVAEVVAATSPFLAFAAAIGAIVVAAHDMSQLFSGEDFKNTWTGQALDAVAGKVGIKNAADRTASLFGGNAYAKTQEMQKAYAQTPSVISPSTVSGANPDQSSNSFNINQSFTLAPGTTPQQAVGIISDSAVSAKEKIKAQQDASRKRVR